MPTARRLPRIALIGAAASLALLAACGGGGDEAPPDQTVSQSTAEAMSANSGEVPTDSARSSAEILTATQAVVAAGQASQTVACAGGGTAVFTVTGGTLASVTNGVLDAGEVYTLTYNACRGAAGAARLDGTATLTVVTASGGTTVVDTTTQGLAVTLPRRTITQNGSSRLSRTVTTNGATTVTTERWTSPQIQLTSVRSARTSTFTLSAVDVTRTLTTTGGTLTGVVGSGTYTMGASLPGASWSITVATLGDVAYDVNGVPTLGAWTITLPQNHIGVSVAPGTVIVTLDKGPDGVIDATWTFTTTAIGDEAG